LVAGRVPSDLVKGFAGFIGKVRAASSLAGASAPTPPPGRPEYLRNIVGFTEAPSHKISLNALDEENRGASAAAMASCARGTHAR